MRSFRPSPLWETTAAIVLGACGMMGQVLLWRELLALYQGNELTTGIILANWLLAEAGGAWMFSRWPSSRGSPFFLFAALSGLYAVALPGSMVLTRLFRPSLGLAIGEPVGPLFTMLSSLLLLAPAAFLHGALFPATIRLFRHDPARPTGTVIGSFYVLESIGTLLGAMAWMAYSSTGGHGFTPTATVAVITVLLLLLRKEFSRASRRILYRTLLVAGATGALMVSWRGGAALHTWSLARQYQPYRVLGALSSPHGNWVVLDADKQHLFLMDGQPAYLTPVPDRSAIEEMAHLPLLFHNAPRRLCLIGGGAGGLLNEILKHPSVETVDYTEVDPALFELFRRFPTDLTARELGDARVRIHLSDGRRFLLQSRDTFDVIWVNILEPATLQANRYYTLEFFSTLRPRLADDGIVIATLPGRLAYPSPDLRIAQAGFLNVLHRVVGSVRLLPGEGRFIYLASPQRALADVTAEDLTHRARARGLEAAISTYRHLEQRLHPGWQKWVAQEYHTIRAPINRDSKPVTVFHLLAHHQGARSPLASALLLSLRRRFWLTVPVAAACWFAFRRLPWRRSRNPATRWPIFFQVATTGFAGMLLNLLLIFSLQSALGHVQMWIGLLMAAFMIGAASAAFIAAQCPPPVDRLSRVLRLCEVALCCYCSVLPWLLLAVNAVASRVEIWAAIFFAALNAGAGALTGVLFPLAAHCFALRESRAERTAGRLQTVDLTGGWLAGLLGASFLLPLAGVAGACLLIVVLKGLSLFLLCGNMKV